MKGNQIAGVRNWLQLFWTLAFLALTQTGIPALAGTEDGTSPVGLETAGPHDPNEPPITWVDESHTAITNQAQALTEWMDAFFGDPNYDLEQAEAFPQTSRYYRGHDLAFKVLPITDNHSR